MPNGDKIDMAIPQTAQTAFQPLNLRSGNFENIDQLVSSRTSPAIGLLNEGSRAQLGLARQGLEAGTAPQIQTRQNQAELSGLRGIASARSRSQTQSQLASLAGTLAGQFANRPAPAFTLQPYFD